MDIYSLFYISVFQIFVHEWITYPISLMQYHVLWWLIKTTINLLLGLCDSWCNRRHADGVNCCPLLLKRRLCIRGLRAFWCAWVAKMPLQLSHTEHRTARTQNTRKLFANIEFSWLSITCDESAALRVWLTIGSPNSQFHRRYNNAQAAI